MDEKEELEQYEEDMKWLEEAEKDPAWFTRLQREAKTNQQLKRMHLFLVRFTTILWVPVTCSGCGKSWRLGDKHYCCLDCPNVNLCEDCFYSGSKPESHSPETHDVLLLRFRCKGCRCYIVGSRYHCNECEDFDLCAGCHSVGKFPIRHNLLHRVTKIPLLTGTIITVDEQEELQQYEEEMKWLAEAKQDFSTWDVRMRKQYVTTYEKRRHLMFSVRFCHMCGINGSCVSCGIDLWRGMTHYACLICLDPCSCRPYILCNFCYECGAKPEADQKPFGHSESHEVVRMSVWCDGCGGCIVGTQYHCNECEDFDLCAGCRSTGNFPERHSSIHKMTKYLTEKGTKNVEGRQELQQYEENMTWLKETKKDFPAWFTSTLIGAKTEREKRRAHLFLAQFSNVLDVIIQCQGCGVALPRGKGLRCLNCLDVNLCFKCHKREVEPEGHSETHDVIRMGFCCSGCGSYIVQTRYHCNECEDFDLCAGCRSSGNFPESHSGTHEEVSFPPKKGKKVAVMSKRKQAVLAHKIAFWISLYLFITSRVSEAIKICKESLLLINHKALVNEIEFVSVVRLLADPLMAFGYMYLEDTLSFAKHLLHLCLISPGRTFKTIFKPSRLQELYKRQCKYDKAQALWMETGEKEEEYLDEVFPSFFDEISPEECQFASATVHEMGTLPRECLSGKSLIRQACSSLVKSNNLLKETLSMLEFFDKEKAQHPHHYKCLLDKIYFHDYSVKYLKQELKSLTKRGRAASIHQCRVYGKSWVLLGDYSEAKANFEKALAISIEQRDRKEEAAGYGLLGAVFQYLRRYNEAEKNLEKQVAIYKEIGDIHGQARSYENLGTLYRFLDDTVKAKEYFRKALEIAKKTGHREIETSCCKKLGDVYASLGNPDSAKKFADKAFLLNKETGNDNVLFLMMKSLFKDETGSQLFANLQRLDFEFTRGYDDEITSLFSDQGFLGHKMMSFAFCCLGNHHAGLCLAELARARALADFLSVQYSVEMKRSLDYFNPQKRIGMERILKTERNCCCLYISYFSQFISVWLLKADHPLRFQGIKVSDFFAKSLSNDADASCRKIDRNKHHLTPEQDKDQSLFPSQYFQENNLPFSRLIEEDDDEEVQRTTLAPADYYNTTIAPVVDFLDEPEIIIFPDRVFSRLPFAALKDKRGKYLSETFRIRIAPSLTTLKMIQDSPADYHSQTGALIVGDPDVGRVLYKEISCQIPRLPDASKEAKMIGRLLGVQPLLGKQATKKQILQSINSVSLIHFAAHGDDKRGEIFLAPPPMLNRTPQEEDYLLTMQEILQVRVRAKLVVLSCCHSANGKIRQEGVVGIGRAFLASGARSVLVALWAIEDKATYQLMIRFYEHLVRGESASESLHQAMKWMRENGYSKVGQWAPFMLIGDNVSFDFQRIRPASHETQPY